VVGVTTVISSSVGGEDQMDESAPKATAPEGEEITSDYANNVLLESTIWDLKLIFGEFSQRTGSVEWHTSMTIPWAQAKLLSHYLQVNVEVWESNNGRITIPEIMIPKPPPPLTPEQEKDPKMKAAFETISRHNQKFVESL
jgi:hypothetical protein